MRDVKGHKFEKITPTYKRVYKVCNLIKYFFFNKKYIYDVQKIN